MRCVEKNNMQNAMAKRIMTLRRQQLIKREQEALENSNKIKKAYKQSEVFELGKE